MKINDMLKIMRNAKGLTQKQVADALGMKQYNLSDYETGRAFPDIDTLIKLADLYEISLDDLCNHIPKLNSTTFSSNATISEYIKDLYTLKIIRRIENLNDKEKELVYANIDTLIKTMFNK